MTMSVRGEDRCRELETRDGMTTAERRQSNDSPSERRRDKKKKSHRKERRRSTSSSDDRHSKNDRKHKRKHHRRRSSSRSRSRSRSPGHRSSDKRRRHKKHSRHSRSRSRGRSRSRSSDTGDSWRYDQRNEDSYKFQTPNNTVMIRGLAEYINESHIRQDLLKCGILIKDIRLIRNRDTGISRGFAFAEFHTVADAKKWMELKKGVLVFDDASEANLIYSVSKGGGCSESVNASSDWYCTKCMAYNFKRREICYKCDEPKPPESETGDLSCEMSPTPTTSIMLFELDALTTEDSVLQAFQSHPQLTSIPIRSVRIPREQMTNLSKCICYVESNTVADSIHLFAVFSESPLDIDGVQVQAAYHRPTPPAVKSNAAAMALAAAQWTNKKVECPTDETDDEKMAEYSASLYAKNATEYASYLEYYRDYYKKKGTVDQGISKTTVAPASCSAEIKNGQIPANNRLEMTASGSPKVSWPEATGKASQKTPNPSRFEYDDASGYYIDPDTGYYYDATNQYYYDSRAQKYLTWDSEKHTYTSVKAKADDEKMRTSNKSVSKDAAISSQNHANANCLNAKEKKAKNVAKEMERWAKRNNQRKDILRELEISSKWAIGTQETAKTDPVDEEEDSSSSNGPFDMHMVAEREAETALGYGVSEAEAFLDKQKIACLLCKRQFTTVDVLLKHAKMSELHKQNLAEVLGVQQFEPIGNSHSSMPAKVYRDRAKERRLKFGSEAATPSSSLKDLYIKAKEENVGLKEDPKKPKTISEDNIGNKLLQKMGWQAGQGLGKDSKGITDPITAERRFGKLGLGMDVPASVDVDESDDRQTKAKKITLARYMKLS